ncbi:hypothetical protein GCM10010420_45850 [Streptomyces glaucosporus]|uniref:Transcriptional regulator n=1 Tax=Streptomyces glaucosporus TaxID=284044 RepID=A0ABN3IQP0_9ACTN
MRKGTPEYEDALADMVEILRDRARRRAPLTYTDLSRELARRGHHVPPRFGAMPHLLADATAQESPDGSAPLLSALVVLQATGRPSGGFYELARRLPYSRREDDDSLWEAELTRLERHYASE